MATSIIRKEIGPPPTLEHAAAIHLSSEEKVEMVAVQAIKGGYIKARVRFNRKWFTPDDPEWFVDWIIEFEGEPTFAAVLILSTKHGRREKVSPRFQSAGDCEALPTSHSEQRARQARCRELGHWPLHCVP